MPYASILIKIMQGEKDVRISIISAALLVALSASPTFADDCAHTGGTVTVCADYWRAQDLQELHGVFYSAATMSLSKASCVAPGAVFQFHAARNIITDEISQRHNDIMITRIWTRFPLLAKEIVRGGWLNKLDYTVKTGRDLEVFGVPMCYDT